MNETQRQDIQVRDSFSLTPAEAESIRYICAYDFSMIRQRIVKGGHLGEEVADEAIGEYRRYFILTRLSDRLGLDALPMCSAEVDEVWHAHLVCTRDYATFCQTALGRFAHHEPTVVEGHDPSVLAFFEAYGKVFGEVGRLWRSGCKIDAIDPFREALLNDEAMQARFQAALPELVAGLGINRRSK